MAAPNIEYPTTDKGWCDYFIELDKVFGTDKRSPLHHDNRCSAH